MQKSPLSHFLGQEAYISCGTTRIGLLKGPLVSRTIMRAPWITGGDSRRSLLRSLCWRPPSPVHSPCLQPAAISPPAALWEVQCSGLLLRLISFLCLNHNTACGLGCQPPHHRLPIYFNGSTLFHGDFEAVFPYTVDVTVALGIKSA